MDSSRHRVLEFPLPLSAELHCTILRKLPSGIPNANSPPHHRESVPDAAALGIAGNTMMAFIFSSHIEFFAGGFPYPDREEEPEGRAGGGMATPADACQLTIAFRSVE